MLFIIIFVVILIIVGCIYNKDNNHQPVVNNKQQEMRDKRYRESIAPSPYYSYGQISMPLEDQRELGGNGSIHYMYAYIGSFGEHVVTFPESRYGNSAKYYLLNIRFHPKYMNISSGYTSPDRNDYTYEGFFGGYHTVRSPESYNGYSTKKELPSTALLTFTPANFSRTIVVSLKDTYQSDINFYIKHYLLDKIEKHKILDARNYIKSLAPSCGSYYYYRFPPNTYLDNQITGSVHSKHKIHYMFLNRDDGTITFPESNEGNSKKYYLIKIFTEPKDVNDYYMMQYFIEADDITQWFYTLGYGWSKYEINNFNKFLLSSQKLHQLYSSSQLKQIQKDYQTNRFKAINTINKHETEISQN